MFKVEANKSKDDSSLEFRKCWSLGESFYYLSRDYIYSEENIGKQAFEGKSEFIKFYKGRIEIIQSICESMMPKSDIKVKSESNEGESESIVGQSESIDNVLDELRMEDYENSFPEFIKNFDFNKLEYLLVGKLAGIEPRYEDIFRTAKHCQGLYRDDGNDNDDIFNFINDLDTLRNFISMDKRTLIKKVVAEGEWNKVRGKYKSLKEKEYKNLKEKEYRNLTKKNKNLNDNKFEELKNKEHKDLKKAYKEYYDSTVEKFPIAAKIKPPETVHIVDKIAGLILGSVEISDILKKRDHCVWVLICYILFGLLVVLLVGLIIITVYIPYQTVLIDYIKLFVPATGQELVIILTAIGTIGTAIIPVFRSVAISWEKLANGVELSLAINRLKHPK